MVGSLEGRNGEGSGETSAISSKFSGWNTAEMTAFLQLVETPPAENTSSSLTITGGQEIFRIHSTQCKGKAELGT